MITQPSFQEFKKLAQKGNLVAVSVCIPADLETPVSSFLKLTDGEEYAFLLESAEQEERVGRYSIIGIKPDSVLTATKDSIHQVKGGRKVRIKNENDLAVVLQKELAKCKLANPEGLPDFCGGYMGYFGYENVQKFETIKLSEKKGPNVPDSIFFLCKQLLIFDHFRKTLNCVVIVDVEGSRNTKKLYENAQRKANKLIHCLQKPLRSAKKRKTVVDLKFKSNMSRASFEKKVKRIKEYIRAGDCIQTVLSQRFSAKAKVDDFLIYRALRSVNPSPYMFYFRAKEHRLIGSSPELLVKKEGRTAEVRPIAGTRPRGKNAKDDLRYEEQLRRSKKEMAEHLMLVDLGRNDLGRVCQFNSVKVSDYAHVDRYSHVMHLVSDVAGTLNKGKNAFHLLRATFPAGTVTGAPKIRAMQIIDELEAETRGPYAGCLGYFSFNQNMEVCITIRTLVLEKDNVYLQAGAGIVKDSNPEKEYQETVNKAQALVQAIKNQDMF